MRPMLLRPQLPPRIHLHPLRDLLQRLFYALDFCRPDIGGERGRVAVEGGEGDPVEVDEADVGYASVPSELTCGVSR